MIVLRLRKKFALYWSRVVLAKEAVAQNAKQKLNYSVAQSQ